MIKFDKKKKKNNDDFKINFNLIRISDFFKRK